MLFDVYEQFKNQYPFLPQVCAYSSLGYSRGIAALDGIRVEPITPDILSDIPFHKVHEGSLVNIDRGKRVDFILKSGEVILNAVHQEWDFQSNYAHTSPRHDDGESIQDALDAHELTLGQLDFIVALEYGYNVVDYCSLDNFSITIYSPDVGTERLKKRIRQVRDTLNKCKNIELVEQIAKLLNV